jgi:SAM-dependent methyltransferase
LQSVTSLTPCVTATLDHGAMPSAPTDWLADPRVVAFYQGVERRPDVMAFHAMTTALAPPPAGGSVLDVGCGIGATTRTLGRHVGPLGTVIGIDDAPSLVEVARHNSAGPVRFEVGSVSELAFPDDEFDLVRASWARAGVPDPEAAVRELLRVCRPGGHLVLVDADAGSVSVDVADPRMVAAVLGAVERRGVGERSGFALRGRLVRAGCEDAVASANVFTLTSLADAAAFIPEFNRTLPSRLPASLSGVREEWFQLLERADRAGELLVSMTAWAAAGRKPR